MEALLPLQKLPVKIFQMEVPCANENGLALSKMKLQACTVRRAHTTQTDQKLLWRVVGMGT